MVLSVFAFYSPTLILPSQKESCQANRVWELRRTNPQGFNFDERALQQLGSMLLEKGRNADAIAVFKLNVEEYPKSGNVYDSLAEAYANDGQKHQAITNYRKSLELDPKNQNAANKTEGARTNVALEKFRLGWSV